MRVGAWARRRSERWRLKEALLSPVSLSLLSSLFSLTLLSLLRDPVYDPTKGQVCRQMCACVELSNVNTLIIRLKMMQK